MTKKFGQLFNYLPKSKIKAGSGIEKGSFPFYTCSDKLTKSIDQSLYNCEALIFGTGGNATMHYVDGDFSVSTDCLVAKRKSDEVLTKYVYYYLFSNMCILQRGFRGSGLKHISKSYIDEIDIPILDLEVQKKIINSTDKILRAINQRTEQIELINKHLLDTFICLFGEPVSNPKGFEIRTLSEFYKCRKGSVKCGPFGSALKKNEYVEEGIAVWNMDNITKNGAFIDEPNLYITHIKYEQLSAYGVENEDIIISRAGTVGKMCVVDSKHQPSIISTNLIRLRLDREQLLPLYFVSLISFFGARVARLKTGNDNSFTHMNTGVLDSICFPYPPVELQNKYENILNESSNIQKLLIHSISELETTYKATLQKAFNGELFS